jgi:hypothetical protein
MAYSIYLDSPQLAYQANQRKQYLRIIRTNQRNQNRVPKKYPYSYFQTAYSRFIQSQERLTVGY